MSQESTDQYRIAQEPFYQVTSGEDILYEAAYARRMPVMLKGPTGCGKSRFVDAMAFDLNLPVITVACNEDTSATDLLGRFLIKGNETARNHKTFRRRYSRSYFGFFRKLFFKSFSINIKHNIIIITQQVVQQVLMER